MSYPYLFRSRALYAPYTSYKEAVEVLRSATREEAEKFVKGIWPHAFIYQHGPDWTVLPLDWRDRRRIKEGHPEIEIPATLSLTLTFRGVLTKEQSAKAEEQIWKTAALTLIERDRTAELKKGDSD